MRIEMSELDRFVENNKTEVQRNEPVCFYR
jgi:hypothetical protein